LRRKILPSDRLKFAIAAENQRAIFYAKCYLSWKFTTIRRPFFAIFRENFTQSKQSCFGYLSWKFTTIRQPFFAIFRDDALIWNRAHNQQYIPYQKLI